MRSGIVSGPLLQAFPVYDRDASMLPGFGWSTEEHTQPDLSPDKPGFIYTLAQLVSIPHPGSPRVVDRPPIRSVFTKVVRSDPGSLFT